MNLRDLEYFVAVAELGHFHKAADKCFVSQPTLSGQLKKLEEELGQSLFERGSRKVLLTSFGEEALPLARRALEAAQSITHKAKELADPFQGPVIVGAFPTLGPWIFPSLSPLLHAKFPKLELYFTEEKSPVLLQKLRDGSLDAAMLAMPQTDKNLVEAPLFEEPFRLAIHNEHPWKARQDVQSEELDGLQLLLLEDGHCLRDQALDLCHRYGASERDGTFRATGLETLRQMVRAGTGITLIPLLAVPHHPEPGIHYLPIRNPEPKRSIALYWRSTHPRHTLFVQMAEAIALGATTALTPP